MEYSEALKKNEEDLNVLLGSDLQDLLFSGKTDQQQLAEQQIEDMIPLTFAKGTHTYDSA